MFTTNDDANDNAKSHLCRMTWPMSQISQIYQLDAEEKVLIVTFQQCQMRLFSWNHGKEVAVFHINLKLASKDSGAHLSYN